LERTMIRVRNTEKITCKIGHLQMRYLGVPVNNKRLRNKD
jgi:hypothetical protein